MNPPVFLRRLGAKESTRREPRFHFARHDGRSRCGGFALDPQTETEPTGADAGTRCNAPPCAELWTLVAARTPTAPTPRVDAHALLASGQALDAVTAAAIRRCPDCRRKSALKRHDDGVIRCRWADCGHVASA